ncbi:hypothetical protein J4455_04790 [Candidatus Woesearchaeota archaeon]|nr:hypothetical protein [Candidatus Woesearchaeota archaeon]
MTPNIANYDQNSNLENSWNHMLIRTYDKDTERFCIGYLGPFLCDSSTYFRILLTPIAEQFLKKHQTSKTQDLVSLLHSLMKSRESASIDSKA